MLLEEKGYVTGGKGVCYWRVKNFKANKIGLLQLRKISVLLVLPVLLASLCPPS